MASTSHNVALNAAIEEVAQKLGLNPAMLEANPSMKASLQSICEARLLAEEAAASSATATAPTSTPPQTSTGSAIIVFSTPEPPRVTPVSDVATPALATSAAPPAPTIDATAVISTVLGSLAEDTTATPPTPQKSSPPPPIAPLPVTATPAEANPPILVLPLSSAPLLPSTTVTSTPLHRPTSSRQSSSPVKTKEPTPEGSQSSSPATQSPPKQLPAPTMRVTRTAGKRKAADTGASSKTTSMKRGRQTSKVVELFPEEKAKPEGPSLPACAKSYTNRDVIPPLIIGQELWRTISQREFDVAPVVSALERTGWFKLADVPCVYDLDQIRTFYSAITVVGSPPNYDCAVVTWNGKPLVIDAELIASLTDLPTGEGFCDLQKKSGPLAEFCIRKRMKSPNADKPMPLRQFNFPDQLIHQIIVNNVVPRLDKHELIDNLDQNLMGHVFAGEPVDTPRVILRHLLLSAKSRNHALPYPALVKTIMERYGMYRPTREISADRCLSVAMLRHLKHKDTLAVSPTPSPKPSPPKLRPSTKPESQSTQPATSKSPPTFDKLPVPQDLQQALFQQTAVNIKILELLEEICIRIAHHHKMSKTQFSHIRVLLAGPAPVPHIAKDLPDPEQVSISSDEEVDPAAAAKDPVDIATGVAEEQSQKEAESEDVAKQT